MTRKQHEEAKQLSSLGGRMYGDGEYVVEFSGGEFQLAPLKATVMGGKLGDSYVEISYGLGAKQSISLAAQSIRTAKRTA